MKNKIINCAELERIRKENKKIALCSGCFDILHSGHAVFFKQCKEFAETLVVCLGRDSVIKKLKGSERPINCEKNRASLLAAMEDVDYITFGGEKILPGKIDFYDTIKTLKPDFFILNNDDSAIKEKRELCSALGVEIKLVPRIVPEELKMTSSTEIINKIKKLIM